MTILRMIWLLTAACTFVSALDLNLAFAMDAHGGAGRNAPEKDDGKPTSTDQLAWTEPPSASDWATIKKFMAENLTEPEYFDSLPLLEFIGIGLTHAYRPGYHFKRSMDHLSFGKDLLYAFGVTTLYFENANNSARRRINDDKKYVFGRLKEHALSFPESDPDYLMAIATIGKVSNAVFPIFEFLHLRLKFKSGPAGIYQVESRPRWKPEITSGKKHGSGKEILRLLSGDLGLIFVKDRDTYAIGTLDRVIDQLKTTVLIPGKPTLGFPVAVIGLPDFKLIDSSGLVLFRLDDESSLGIRKYFGSSDPFHPFHFPTESISLGRDDGSLAPADIRYEREILIPFLMNAAGLSKLEINQRGFVPFVENQRDAQMLDLLILEGLASEGSRGSSVSSQTAQSLSLTDGTVAAEDTSLTALISASALDGPTLEDTIAERRTQLLAAFEDETLGSGPLLLKDADSWMDEPAGPRAKATSTRAKKAKEPTQPRVGGSAGAKKTASSTTKPGDLARSRAEAAYEANKAETALRYKDLLKAIRGVFDHFPEKEITGTGVRGSHFTIRFTDGESGGGFTTFGKHRGGKTGKVDQKIQPSIVNEIIRKLTEKLSK